MQTPSRYGKPSSDVTMSTRSEQADQATPALDHGQSQVPPPSSDTAAATKSSLLPLHVCVSRCPHRALGHAACLPPHTRQTALHPPNSCTLQTPPTQPSSASGEAAASTAALPALALHGVPACNTPEGQAAVVQLLRALGRGHSLLAQYKSSEAIAAFGELPAQQFQTAWVLSSVGRAHFELVDYSQALQFFMWARNQDPCRVEGLEWLSTVLWHMKKEVRSLQVL